jgi:hypothetical protein
MTKKEKAKRVEDGIRNLFKEARGPIMDDIEWACYNSPRWPLIRSRVLKALGDGGAQGNIIKECIKFINDSPVYTGEKAPMPAMTAKEKGYRYGN